MIRVRLRSSNRRLAANAVGSTTHQLPRRRPGRARSLSDASARIWQRGLPVTRCESWTSPAYFKRFVWKLTLCLSAFVRSISKRFGGGEWGLNFPQFRRSAREANRLKGVLSRRTVSEKLCAVAMKRECGQHCTARLHECYLSVGESGRGG